MLIADPSAANFDGDPVNEEGTAQRQLLRFNNPAANSRQIKQRELSTDKDKPASSPASSNNITYSVNRGYRIPGKVNIQTKLNLRDIKCLEKDQLSSW